MVRLSHSIRSCSHHDKPHCRESDGVPTVALYFVHQLGKRKPYARKRIEVLLEGTMPTFDDLLEQILALLQREGQVTYRALKRRFALSVAMALPSRMGWTILPRNFLKSS